MTARPASPPLLDDRSDLEALADTVPGAEDEAGFGQCPNRARIVSANWRGVWASCRPNATALKHRRNDA